MLISLIVLVVMFNVILRTVVGFATSIGGLFMGYNYLAGLNESNNLLLLIASIPLTVFGIFTIYRTGRLDVNKAKMQEIIKPIQNTDGEARIKENNQMVKEWVHARESSDKLKILSIQAEEEKTD